ncbi:hypothetical protein AA0312_0565 [Acetobacter tropicalis NRIC 0312]|nr:hypothetical protein ATR1_449d0016 [Acetobacter tropicalis]GBR67715.1 hypothetical protein AA0312_0565 [Acetobacter tropicalis NRIC 0312]
MLISRILMRKEKPSLAVSGSLKQTLIKTASTVALTVLLIALLRELLRILPWLDQVTGLHAGASILQTLAAGGVTQQQQMIAAGLMLLCFLVAVVLVRVGEKVFTRS